MKDNNQRQILKPFLINEGDGVDGHYCIGRKTEEGYYQYWNEKQHRWSSAGTVFKLGKHDK